jgi:hypothetical protein
VILTGWQKSKVLDLEAVEAATRAAMHTAGAGILTALLECDPPTEKEIDCSCGGKARYVGMRPKKILTVVGPANTLRAYYLCNDCHEGQTPADKEIDVEGTSFSPGVRRMMSLVGSQMSFDNGRQ